MRYRILAILMGIAALVAAGTTQTQAAPFSCGGAGANKVPLIKPVFTTQGMGDPFTNLFFECMMWQNFVYLNWPALAGQRGVPNPTAKFGAPGPTVWETYRTIDQTFLPGGRNPGPWNTQVATASLDTTLSGQVSRGETRYLTMQSKVSTVVRDNLARNTAIGDASLKDIVQAGGGTLYDLNGKPVYYEVSMNRANYDYIAKFGLYNANTQVAFAKTGVVSLPTAGMELKVAWKVLSGAEIAAGRFHMVKAILPPSLQPVTVGLVGFHAFLVITGMQQGVWATFGQIDNAPVQGQPASGQYNFFNPNCGNCTPNVKNANPGQVVQVTPDDSSALGLNAYMQGLIKQYSPTSAWQYYKLVNIQWEEKPVQLPSLPKPVVAPLPNGSPANVTVVNPVLETFQQKPGTGCLSCHVYGSVAAVSGGSPAYATSYSFMFGHATTPR